MADRTQLNSTQLTTPKEEWINKRKEAKKLIYIPDSLVNSLDQVKSRCFLKVATVSQLIKDIGKLFHMSIILTVKKKFPNIQMHLWFVNFE